MGLFRIRGLEMRLKPFLSTSTHLLNQSRSLQTLPAYGHNRGVSYIASLVFRCRATAGCARSPRLFFSVSSHQELEWREEQRQPLSSFIKDDRQDRFRLQQDKPGRFVPVRAFFLSTRSLMYLLVLLWFHYLLWKSYFLMNGCLGLQLQHWFEKLAVPEFVWHHPPCLSCHQLCHS